MGTKLLRRFYGLLRGCIYGARLQDERVRFGHVLERLQIRACRSFLGELPLLQARAERAGRTEGARVVFRVLEGSVQGTHGLSRVRQVSARHGPAAEYLADATRLVVHEGPRRDPIDNGVDFHRHRIRTGNMDIRQVYSGLYARAP